mmetsp:Transcript_117373/g.332550  ORF Transcript_117373/g.332550 Transcript_117373/m.332550 type:complete len:237 (+) Transcript_117373:835-1545(+)
MPLLGSCMLAISNWGVHDDGNSGPGLFIANSLQRKASFLPICTSSSSVTNPRRPWTYEAAVSGGTNWSPSTRRSERCGLNTALSSFSSSGLAPDSEPPSMLGQKLRPAGHLSQLPGASSSFMELVVDRSNLSKQRSTPCKRAAELTRAPTTPALGTNCAWMEIGTFWERPTTNWSRPKSTPPYTPCLLLSIPTSASTISPFSIWILEKKRSFQSWGTSWQYALLMSPTMLNHESSR